MSTQHQPDSTHKPIISSGTLTGVTSAETATDIRPNKVLLLLITLLCFLALIILMMFSGNQPALALDDERLLVTQNTRVQFSTLSIAQQYNKPRTVYGQIESVQQSDIGFELGGTLNTLVVLEGASVEKGDVLAQLDTARLLARRNELESSLKNAQANATLAKLSQQRVNKLVSNRLEPQQRLDEAQAQLDAANAFSGEVAARLLSLDVEISKSSLRAPFDGQIVRQYADSGTVVGNGQPVFSILAKTTLEARFGLPDNTAFGVNPQSSYMLAIAGTQFPATAKSISKQRNLATRTIDAVFTIDLADLSAQQKQLMVAGDLVSLTVDITQQTVGAWVPVGALAAGIRGMWTLYVVSSTNEIETRLVSIEFADEKQAYVTGAIAEGDRVVVSGIHRLTPGQNVNNIEELSAAKSQSE
jgi:RND family efflux transporter MFP subunit